MSGITIRGRHKGDHWGRTVEPRWQESGIDQLREALEEKGGIWFRTESAEDEFKERLTAREMESLNKRVSVRDGVRAIIPDCTLTGGSTLGL